MPRYKRDAGPRTADVAQVVAYAVQLGTTSAFLVYPRKELQEETVNVGGIRVRSLGFDLGSDLEAGGAPVLAALRREFEPGAVEDRDALSRTG